MSTRRIIHRSSSKVFESLEKLEPVKRYEKIRVKLVLKDTKSKKDKSAQSKQPNNKFEKPILIASQFAKSNNLIVLKVNRTLGIIDVSGTAKSLEKAFSVELNYYNHSHLNPKFPIVRGHSGPQMVPDKIHRVLKGVIGLSDIPMEHNAIKGPTASAATGVSSQCFADYYNFPNTSGKGQEIVIISCGGGYDPQNLEIYYKKVGIRPKKKIKWVAVQKAKTNQPGVESDQEILTDILVASCAAPGAKITVYSTDNSLWGFADAIQMICEKVKSSIIVSYSWGASESQYTHSEITGCEQLLKYAAVNKNTTIFCASGDKGSTNSRDTSVRELNVQYPASSHWVTSCGGTMFETDKKGNIIAEKVWKAPYLYLVIYTNASGGGFSRIIDRPNYQKNILSKTLYNNPKRGVPDVAGYANVEAGELGYWIYYKDIDWISGGTSAVAPLWAALVARLNEGLGSNIGFFNPLLYKMTDTKVLQPIQKGDNSMPGGPQKWSAGGVWNPCTGLGVPNGKKMLKWLKNSAHIQSL
jgi:kumamolisin